MQRPNMKVRDLSKELGYPQVCEGEELALWSPCEIFGIQPVIVIVVPPMLLIS